MGLDYINQSGPNGFKMGLAFLDVYTRLQTDNNDLDREVQSQPMQVNFGAAWEFGLSDDFGIVVSSDVRNLEDSTVELTRRVHLGFELKLSPALSILSGTNSGLYSYGIKFNTGFFSVYGGFYDADIGEKQGQIISNRAVIYASLFDFTFDG